MAKITFLFLFLISKFSFAQEKPQAKWGEQMQKLQETLINAYPFFFSKNEFKSKENRKKIELALVEFRKNIHSVPVESGKDLLGSEPLIQGSVNRMERAISESIDYLANGDLERSQELVKVSINKCVACHTAHPMGPQFSNFNKEIVNLKLPVLDRVIGLVAIRQYTGALDVLEKSLLENPKRKDANDLIKTHLLISYRAIDDKERASKLLTSMIDNKNTKKENKITYQAWLKAIQENKVTGPNQDNNFVQNLALSQSLHKSMSSNLSKNEKAKAYFNLGQAYNNLELDFLLDLPRLYFQACVDLNPDKETLDQCKSAYKVVMPGI